MTTTAIGTYTFPSRDRIENFHGLQLVNFLWDKHLMFSAPITLVLPPTLPFSEILGEVLPNLYGAHPQFAEIDWSTVEWELDGVAFIPVPTLTLTALGIDHKSLLRFRTPGLEGLAQASF